MECANCAKQGATRLCAICKCLAYCGDECARADWTRHWSEAHLFISNGVDEPNDIDEIPGIPGLYVGGLVALQHLSELDIRAVISAIPYDTRRVTEKQLTTWIGERKHMRVPWEDTEEQIMDFETLCATAQFIDSHLAQGHRVLVHCAAGISRSVSIILFYMTHMPGGKWKTAKRALRHIQKVRPIAGPNKGFISQLKKYQKRTCPRF